MQGFACGWHISVHEAAFPDQNSLDYFQVLDAFQKIAAINLKGLFCLNPASWKIGVDFVKLSRYLNLFAPIIFTITFSTKKQIPK